MLAFATAVFAFLAFRKQSRQVGILAEQNDRDIRDRRRDQASRVIIWAELEIDPGIPDHGIPGIITHVKNTSRQPIYDGRMTYRDPTRPLEADLYTRQFPVLMPDEPIDTRHGFLDPVPALAFFQDNSPPQVSLRFRDAIGVHWQLDTDGQLDEIAAPETPRQPST